MRQIIKIDEDKCDGCGICVTACHEGAIEIVDNVARLIRDDYCDGLGDCLPGCPQGAISFEMRDALAYDEAAVLARKGPIPCSCPGSDTKKMNTSGNELLQWPIQIKLLPIKADFYEGATLLIAADCCAYSYNGFQEQFMKDKVTIIGCPKLDALDYSIKLSEIIKANNINKIVVARMEVPCCGGIEYAVQQAIQLSQKNVPCQVYTITRDGQIAI